MQRHSLRAFLLSLPVAACDIEPSALGETEAEIVDGWAASPELATSIAYVQSLSTAGTTVGCTGSLVAPRWVMTALHCVTAELPSNTWVQIGPDNEYHNVTAIRRAPSDAYYVGMDVVLLRLDTPSAHPPLPIAEPYEGAAWNPGDAGQNLYATAIGWGYIDANQTPTPELRQTIVKIDYVAPSDPDGSKRIQTSRGIGYVCQGDSGSPLLITRGDGSHAIAGVLSSANCQSLGNYARVADGRNHSWVRAQLRGAMIDFDANGTGDTFTAIATGSGYQYYAAIDARGSWIPLGSASQSLANVRFGDFNGDGITDLFTTTPSGPYHQWWYSASGVGAWTPMAVGDAGLADLRFGDFNGDGITDVFAATPRAGGGYQWKYSSAGIGNWQLLAWDYTPPADLRLGDFNGDGVTDVFSITPRAAGGNQWRYSKSGASSYLDLGWAYESLANLRIGDFDGDAISDVFTVAPVGIDIYERFFSSGGVASWVSLASSSEPLTALRIGDFDGDATSDLFKVKKSGLGSFYLWSYSAGASASWAALGSGFEPLGSLRVGYFWDQR